MSNKVEPSLQHSKETNQPMGLCSHVLDIQGNHDNADYRYIDLASVIGEESFFRDMVIAPEIARFGSSAAYRGKWPFRNTGNPMGTLPTVSATEE